MFAIRNIVRNWLLAIAFLVCFFTQTQAQLTQPGVNPPGKNYWKGLKGEDSLSISRVWAASLLVPSYSQAYNRDYWKIPVVWGGIAGCVFGGYASNIKWMDTGESHYRTQRNLLYAGAALVYWASLMDGVVSYKTNKEVIPARATIYSAMLPGLGQVYNGHYWKIPIIYGGLVFTSYLYSYNSSQYQRFRDAYNALTDNNPNTTDEFNGRMSSSQLKSYRDNFRRQRDYAVVYTGLVYLLNIIDANVFAHLSDFDVSDDLTMKISPTLLYENIYASRPLQAPAVGMRLNITF